MQRWYFRASVGIFPREQNGLSMQAELITIGDELLIGQVVNTNAVYIGEKLAECGVTLCRITTVGDDEQLILDAFAKAWRENDVVLATGGLGPTHDDVTRGAVVRFFDTRLVMNEEVLADIRRLFGRRGREIHAINEEQALVPEIAAPLRNPIGTAPGLRIEKEKRCFFVMPGVPSEMRAMMEAHVLPFLSALSGAAIRTLTLQTTGIFESSLALALGDMHELAGGDRIAFLPGTTGVRIRITVRRESAPAAERRVAEIRDAILSKTGAYVYGYGGEELEETVGRLLKERGLTLAAAESCTGGLLGHRITNVPGSSAWFLQDLVTYSNDAKTRLLGVPAGLIASHGAVSAEVASAMAENARTGAGASIGISLTGIAGPEGGVPGKPVGTVWIGYSDARETTAHRFRFGDRRLENKERFAQAALELLRRKLLGLDLTFFGHTTP